MTSHEARVQALAKQITAVEPPTGLRIGQITAVRADSKVQTSETGIAWIARSQDATLAVGDRVWMVQQRGTFVVAGRLTGGPATVRLRRKNALTARTNATIADDPDIQITLPVGAFRVEAILNYTGPTAGDLSVVWSFSGTLAYSSRAVTAPTTTSDSFTAATLRSQATALTTEIVYGANGDTNGVGMEDLLLGVTVAGTLRLRWAQGTTNATATNLLSGTRIIVTPVFD